MKKITEIIHEKHYVNHRGHLVVSNYYEYIVTGIKEYRIHSMQHPDVFSRLFFYTSFEERLK